MTTEIHGNPSALLAKSAIPFDAVLKLVPDIQPVELREKISALLTESAEIYDPACMQVLDMEHCITRHLETLAVEACEGLDINLVQAEPEQWSWIGGEGTASDRSFDTDVDAAMDALRYHLSKDAWLCEVENGFTVRGFTDWFAAKVEEAAFSIRISAITGPLTRKQIEAVQDERGYIAVVVEFSLAELVGSMDIEGLNDIANSKIFGDILFGNLSDISYSIVGHKANDAPSVSGGVLICVTACVDLLD